MQRENFPCIFIPRFLLYLNFSILATTFWCRKKQRKYRVIKSQQAAKKLYSAALWLIFAQRHSLRVSWAITSKDERERKRKIHNIYFHYNTNFLPRSLCDFCGWTELINVWARIFACSSSHFCAEKQDK